MTISQEKNSLVSIAIYPSEIFTLFFKNYILRKKNTIHYICLSNFRNDVLFKNILKHSILFQVFISIFKVHFILTLHGRLGKQFSLNEICIECVLYYPPFVSNSSSETKGKSITEKQKSCHDTSVSHT